MIKKAITILAVALMLTAVTAPQVANAAEGPVAEAIQEAPAVKVRAGGVVIEVPGDATMHVVIYALTGQVIKQCDVAPGATTIELPAGYYIVRVGHITAKVAVK